MEKVRDALKIWERKFKYAQNKVKKYRARLRRYERIVQNPPEPERMAASPRPASD